jgi:hypothetical protein
MLPRPASVHVAPGPSGRWELGWNLDRIHNVRIYSAVEFEWPEVKRHTALAARGLDFINAEAFSTEDR